MSKKLQVNHTPEPAVTFDCGQTQNDLWCDGSHAGAGFRSPRRS